MSISATDIIKVGTFKADGAKRAEPAPLKALTAAIDKVTGPIEKQVDELKAQLKKLKAGDPSRVYLKERLEKAEGMLGYDVTRVSGEKGRALLFKQEQRGFDEADAGHAKAACKNATLFSAGFGYGTHAPMAGFLTDVPKDKKVTFNVICSPSSHAGGTEADKEKNFEKFARENEYVAEIYYQPAGATNQWDRKLIASTKFKVNGETPEYASISPDMTVDLSQFKGGKLMIEGSAIGSAGVEGYVESRRTTIDL